MSTIGRAVIDVVPSTAQFEAQAKSGLGPVVRKVATAMAAAFATERVFDFGKQAVEEAAKTQKASEAVQATLGKQSEAVLKFGDNAATAYGIGKGASTEFASQLALTAQNIGLTNKQAAQQILGYQKLAGAVGAIKGEDPSQFFDVLSKAMLGNTRGLKQMGIAFTSADQQREAMRLGFIKTTVSAKDVAKAQLDVKIKTQELTAATKEYGPKSIQAEKATSSLKGAQERLSKAIAGGPNSTVGSLTQAQKAQVIYGLATKNLGKLQDQAKAHSHDLANEQIRLSAEFANVKEEIGQALLPTITELATWLGDNLPGAIDTAKTTIGFLVAAFQDLKANIPTPVIIGLGSALAGLEVTTAAVEAAQAVGAATMVGYSAALVDLAASEGIAAAAGLALEDAVGLLANPMIAIPAAIGLAVAAFVIYEGQTSDMSKANQFAQQTTEDLGNAIQDLHDTMLGVKDAQLGVKEANLRLAEAQQHLTDLIHHGKKGTDEYKNAQLEVRRAELGVAQSKDLLTHRTIEHNKAINKERQDSQKSLNSITKTARAAQEGARRLQVGTDGVRRVTVDATKAAVTFRQSLSQQVASEAKATASSDTLTTSQRRGRAQAIALKDAAIELSQKIGGIPTQKAIKVYYRNNMSRLIGEARDLANGINSIPLSHNTVVSITRLNPSGGGYAGNTPRGVGATGGMVQRMPGMAAGGSIPMSWGVPGKDSVALRLKPGEVVLNDQTQDRLKQVLFGTKKTMERALGAGSGPTVNITGPITVNAASAGDFVDQLQQLAWRSS